MRPIEIFLKFSCQTPAFIVYPIVYPMKLCIEGWKKPWYTPVFDSQTKQSTVEMPILPGFSNGAVSF